MTAPAVHRVRRLSWQVRAHAPAQAFALRSRLQAQTDALPALLERVLDDVARARVPPGMVWRIPRLTLQLDLAPGDLPDAELRPLLEAALRQALASALEGTVTPLPAATSEAAAEAGSRIVGGSSAPRLSTAQADARAAFDHYLGHGDLPWPQQTLPPEQQLALLRAEAQAALDDLRNAGAGVAARRSLLAVLPTGDGARRGALARWLALLPSAQADVLVETTLGRAPDERAGAMPLDTPDARAQAVLAALGADAARPQDKRRSAARPSDPQPPADAVANAAAPTPDVARDAGPHTRAVSQPGETSPAHAATAAAVPDRAAAGPVGRAPLSSDPSIAQLVPLAGLVLLHPYLPRLLQGRGLVGERARDIADAALPHACALVHALAAGSAPAQEYALPFVKLLLGRAPDTPLSTALPPPDEADLAEAAALLQAVRTHWPAMAGTGDDALRVSFLQRRGLLSRADGAWQLRMEREPFDLLLGLLPWGIGLVRTPWMHAPLTVEWPAA